jgi:octanoyl-[GcvH]:protein N-octanoyltransferase
VEEIAHEPDALPGVQDRFGDRGERLARALRTLGVDARVGEVPREYCAGRHSVNARGAVKLAGTAQRVVRGGWLFGAVITVSGADRLRAVLSDVYAALAIDLDPATVGSVADEAPGVTIDDVRAAVADAYERRGTQVR